MIRKPVPPGSNFKHSCRPAPPTRRPKGQPAASLFETNEEHRLARSDAPPILSPVGPAVGARLHRDRACYDGDGGCRDAVLEEQVAATEILLIDLGASSEELAAALGPDGYAVGCSAKIATRRSARW
jgi:hypothetical protein